MQSWERLIGSAGGDVTSFSRTAAASSWGFDVDLADSWHGKRLIARNSGESGACSKCGTKAYALPIETGLWSESSGAGGVTFGSCRPVCQTLLSNTFTRLCLGSLGACHTEYSALDMKKQQSMYQVNLRLLKTSPPMFPGRMIPFNSTLFEFPILEHLELLPCHCQLRPRMLRWKHHAQVSGM